MALDSILKSEGVDAVRLRSPNPNPNGYSERFVRSITSECLAQVIPLGESDLRCAVSEYLEHDHCERNHQSVGNMLTDPPATAPMADGPVECQDRVGGLLRYDPRAT